MGLGYEETFVAQDLLSGPAAFPLPFCPLTIRERSSQQRNGRPDLSGRYVLCGRLASGRDRISSDVRRQFSGTNNNARRRHSYNLNFRCRLPFLANLDLLIPEEINELFRR